MKATRSVNILAPILIFLSLLSFWAMPSQDSLAQGQPLPTPTNIGGGGGGNGNGDGNNSDDKATPKPPGARVSGFVYDYSSGGYAGGVTVVLSGGGWEAKTVTDSNGFYQIGDLGSGQGVLNLGLPDGAHQVGPDWPVLLTSGSDLKVDLGFYWGDTAPFPVLLSSNLQDDRLNIQVQNRTAETITGGLLTIELPASLVASPAIQASLGQVDFGEHRLTVLVDKLPAQASASVQVPVAAQTVPDYAQAETQIQLLFTYDQQRTPQIVQLQANQPASAAPPAASTPAAVAAAATPTAAPAPPTPVVKPAISSLMPTTGQPSRPASPIGWVWPLLLAAGLGWAGLSGLTRR
jgi:hypothetical protein